MIHIYKQMENNSFAKNEEFYSSNNKIVILPIEVEADKLKITRRGDFIQLGGKFPRLTKKDPKARLKEIKRLLLAI